MAENIYLGKIDGTGDAREILIAAINKKTGQNYTLTDFEFGEPEAVGVPTPTHNTVVRFGPKLTSKYYGVSRIYYSRIHASELQNVVVPFNGQARVSDLLDAINEKYGILITVDDIVDNVLPALPPGSNNVQVNLVFSAKSLIFYSGTPIQLGLNDPTGDTIVQEPYKTNVMAVFDQMQSFEGVGGTRRLMDFFTLGLDRDNTRTTYAESVQAMKRGTAADYERFGIPAAAYDKIKHHLPFVGMWCDEAGGFYYAMTVLADIYRCPATGGDWVYIGNALNYNTSTGGVAAAGYVTPYVKALAQGSDGSIYILGKPTSGAPRVYKGQVNGTGWVAQTVATTRIKSLTESEWANLVVHDVVFSAGRMTLMITTPTLYDVHVTKSRTTPAIEVLNVANGTSNYFPLAETLTNYSGIGIDLTVTTNRWRLVTPTLEASEVDAVALVTSSVNNNTLALYFRYNPAGEYAAEVLPHSEMAITKANLDEMDIQAYKILTPQIAATQNGAGVTGQYLEVIEIITAVEVDNFNRYFVKTGSRSQKKFLAYGIRTLISLATRNARGAWHESDVAFLGAQRPTAMVTYHPGRRCHYTVQNTSAINTIRIRQIVGTQLFEPLLDATRNIQGYSGATGVGRQGAGVFQEKTLIIDDQTPILLTAPGNEEASMAPIKYSFLAKNASAERVWYTAENPNTLLVRRQSSVNYAFLGGTPAAVLAEGNKLLLWSRNAGVFISNNYGASWSEFNSAPAFYRQERPASGLQNITGVSKIQLSSSNFVEGVVVQGKLTMHLKIADQVALFDINSNVASDLRVMNDEMLFFTGQGPAGNKYVESKEQAGFGMNALGVYSPRRVMAWDTDAQNQYESIGAYTSDLAAPYASKWNQDNYIYAIPGTLLDFSRDVKYLGVRHWVLMQDGDITKLHFTDAVQPKKTFNLNGDPESIYGTFMPEVNFHLWEFVNDSLQYAPYIFYGAGRALLLEPIKQDNTFDVSLHVLTIPNDNGQPLKPIKMYTANRRDYLVYQKGNGIFKFLYNYNPAAEIKHTVSLQKVFDLTSTAHAALEFESGAIADIESRNAPMEVLNPDNMPAGTYMGWHCEGYKRVDTYADGNGGHTRTETPNSLDCNFVPAVTGSGSQQLSGQE